MAGDLPDYMRGNGHSEFKLVPGIKRVGEDPLPPGKKEDDDDFGFCAGGRAAKHYEALAVYRNGKRIRVFEYTGKAVSYEGDNERLDLVFEAADTTWLVIVHGVRLEQLLLAIKERKVDWIREAAGSSGTFEPPHDRKPWIRKIDITEVREEARGNS